MTPTPRAKPLPVRLHGRVVGTILEGVYRTKRTALHHYANIPCKRHGTCAGQTISQAVLDYCKHQDVRKVEITFTHKGETMLMKGTLQQFLDGAVTTDNYGEPQRSVPDHDLLVWKPEEKRYVKFPKKTDKDQERS